MNFKTTWAIIKETFKNFSEDRVVRLAAATAYYAVFSIGPLLVLLVGVAGLVFGEETVRKEVHRQVQSLVGGNSAKLVSSMMQAQTKGGSLMATIVGGAALILGASGVFGQLQDSLNTIWGVTSKPGQGFWVLLRARFFSLATVFGIGFLLVVSMALSAFVNACANYLGSVTSLPPFVMPVANGLVSFIIISFLFALMFKVLPDVKMSWRYVWIGGIATSLLFTAGKFLLGFYLSREAHASAYGAGSAFVIILLYIYYSSLIVYLGAEFTRAYAARYGSGIQPSHYAVQITEEQRAEQGMPHQSQVQEKAKTSRPPSSPPANPGKPALAGAKHELEPFQAAASLGVHTQSPAQHIRAQSWTVVSLGLSLGLVAGVLWRAKGLRHVLRTFRLAKDAL